MARQLANLFCKGQDSKYFRLCGQQFKSLLQQFYSAVLQKQPRAIHKRMRVAVFQ